MVTHFRRLNHCRLYFYYRLFGGDMRDMLAASLHGGRHKMESSGRDGFRRRGGRLQVKRIQRFRYNSSIFNCSLVEVSNQIRVGFLGLSFFLPVYTTKKINNSLRKATSRINGQVHLALGAKWSTGYQGDIHVPHQYPTSGLLSYQSHQNLLI
jgi:hypothetical protein